MRENTIVKIKEKYNQYMEFFEADRMQELFSDLEQYQKEHDEEFRITSLKIGREDKIWSAIVLLERRQDENRKKSIEYSQAVGDCLSCGSSKMKRYYRAGSGSLMYCDKCHEESSDRSKHRHLGTPITITTHKHDNNKGSRE